MSIKNNKLLTALSPLAAFKFAKDLKHHYGIKFTLMIFSNYVGIKGALKSFIELGELPYYREAGWNLLDYQKAIAFSSLPWAIKGFPGILSDLFPIFGFEKSSYLIIYSILGFSSLLVITFAHFDSNTSHFGLPATFFFLAQCQSSFSDILLEGKYVDLMNKYQQNNGSIISFSYFCISLGSLIPASSAGILADRMDPRFVIGAAIPFSLQSFFFILAGCCIEDKVPPYRNNRFDIVKAKRLAPIFILATIMTFGGMGQGIVAIFGTSTYSTIYSAIAATILHISAFIGLPLFVAKLNLYLFLGQTLYINITPVMNYYYTSNENCSNGPHFNYSFYVSIIAIITHLANFIGIWLFQSVFTQFTYRMIFWFSSLLRCIASLIDLIMVEKWHHAIGIPDHLMFLFGQGVIYNVVYMLEYLPFTLMIAKICPKNVEVTLFSLMSGFANYGGSISKFLGNSMTELLGVYAFDGGPCNFENLSLLIILSNTIIPLLLVPLAFFFIPNKYVGENISETTFENASYLIPLVKYQHQTEQL